MSGKKNLHMAHHLCSQSPFSMSLVNLSRRLGLTAIAALSMSVVIGCDDSESESGLESGPPGEMVRVNPKEIKLGDAGGASSTGGATAGGALPGVAGNAGSTGVSRIGALGKTCDTDSDCPAPLSCRSDEDYYVAHKQCVVSCKGSDECEAFFGERSFCIGAEICVRPCSVNTDCPSLTQCGDAGWCKRGGPGSGIPTCVGFATPCALLSNTQCSIALGCSDDSRCSGISSSCYSRSLRYSCEAQSGCSWDSSSDDCSGVSDSCLSFFGSLSCAGQSGCYWQEGCIGISASCDSLPVSLCSKQPGCMVTIE